MKKGHCTGQKRERKDSTDWYRSIEEENIRRVEETEQEKQQASK
jgi:hypothetical protein